MHCLRGRTCCSLCRYAARTRLAPAMYERLRLRSADLPAQGGQPVGTPTNGTQPATPASVAEGAAGFSPLTSAKSVTRCVPALRLRKTRRQVVALSSLSWPHTTEHPASPDSVTRNARRQPHLAKFS